MKSKILYNTPVAGLTLSSKVIAAARGFIHLPEKHNP